jgi:hypothetical protein
MNDNKNDALILLGIVFVFSGAMGWMVSLTGAVKGSWGLEGIKYGCSILGALVFYWRFRMMKRVSQEGLSDFLGERFKTYFEQEGLCVRPAIEVDGGMGVMRVYYQNRYDRPCVGRFEMVVNATFTKRRKLKPVYLEFNVAGGEFGVMHVPYGILQALGGKKANYALGMKVKYPKGKGNILRVQRGSRMGKSARDYSWVLALLLLPYWGILLLLSRSANVTLTLPSGVMETVPEGAAIRQETLNRSIAETNGFEVIVGKKEAA